MVERVDGTHPTAMASKFSSETDIYLVTRLSRLSLVVMVVGFGVQGSLRDCGCLIVPVLTVLFWGVDLKVPCFV